MSDLLNKASLVVIPSGYKEDTVYSVVPSDGSGDLSFTRASNGTRINSSGLVEVCPWNLLQYSEDFANAWWGKDVGSSVDSNVATAPNGTSTADRLNYTSAGQAIYRVISFSGTNKFSVYLKGEGANIGKQIQLEIGAIGGFNVTLTGDWVRHEVEASNATSVAIKKATSGQADAVLAWGIQVNLGSTAKPYFPTTDRLNVPRLTYQNGGGGCPSLLLEPQRTNVETWSEDFSNASWTKTNSSITANTTTSPDGTQNADKIIENSSNGVHFVFNVGATISVAQTLSVYAKADTRTQLALQLGASSVIYNLSSGTIVSGTGGLIENAGNGWYRCSITTTPANTNALIFTANGGTNSYAGDGTSGLFIWGAQLEAGAYPTSLINTTSASATRVADSFSRNNIYTNGLITSSGGTWFVELLNNLALTRDTASIGLFIDTASGGFTNGFTFRNGGGANRLSITKCIAGVLTQLYTTTTDTTKIAIKWNGTSADIFVNGVKKVTATAFTSTNMEFLSCSATDVPKFISQMDLFPTPLTDAECIALTTL